MMFMNFIQKVRFIHSEFEEKCGVDNTKVDQFDSKNKIY